MTAQATNPALHLALLEAKAQEAFPKHTYKAVLHRLHWECKTDQDKAEMLDGLISEFERGLS